MSRCGPPARPPDSWGSRRQLRPTARPDSLIMEGFLLWLPNTHSDICTHINHPNPNLLWLYPWALSNQSTAWATCPSKTGKVESFDISIKLPHQGGGAKVMVVFRVRGEQDKPSCAFMFVFSFVPLVLYMARHSWTKQPGRRPERNVLSWWGNFIKTYFSVLVPFIVFKPWATHTYSSLVLAALNKPAIFVCALSIEGARKMFISLSFSRVIHKSYCDYSEEMGPEKKKGTHNKLSQGPWNIFFSVISQELWFRKNEHYNTHGQKRRP